MWKKAATGGMAAILLLVLAACGNGKGNGDTAAGQKEATDVMGHKVVYPAQPERILAPYLEDPLSVLGVKPVAQTGRAGGQPEYEYLQEWMQGVPVIDLSGTGLTYENVLAQQPDLLYLFHPGFAQDGQYEQYSKIASTYVLDNQSDWRTTLRTMGGMLDRKDKAEQAIADYDDYAAQSAKALAEKLGDARVAVMSLNADGMFKLWGAAFWSGKVLYEDLKLNQPDLIAGKDILDNLSLEALSQLQDTGYIFLIDEDGNIDRSGLLESEIWKSLPAAKQNHVYIMPEKYWMINGMIANKNIISDVRKSLGL